MKSRIVVFFLLIVAVAAFSYPEQGQIIAPSGSMWGWDPVNGVWRPIQSTATGAMPITTEGTPGLTIATMPIITVGTPSVNLGSSTLPVIQKPIATGSSEVINVNTVSQAIPSFPGRTLITFTHLSTETCWIKTYGTTAIIEQGKPLYEGGWISFAIASDVPIAIVSSSPALVEVDQGVEQ